MRRFEDAERRAWDVVVGRESWGAFFAIFVPSHEGAVVRQALLGAEDPVEASRELDALDEDGLRRLLDESKPKELA